MAIQISLNNSYVKTDETASIIPMADSYGISFIRSRKAIFIAPPVAWKNDPCGRWSATVAPAFVIAAPHMPEIPAARIAGANEAEAIVAPAVVDAVAADMIIPDRGASNGSPIALPESASTSSPFTYDAFIMPAIVPVPISKTATGIILDRP